MGKLSDYPSASSLVGTELVPIIVPGSPNVNKKATAAQIAALGGGSGGAGGTLATLSDVDFSRAGPKTVLGVNSTAFGIAERVSAAASGFTISLSLATPANAGDLLMFYIGAWASPGITFSIPNAVQLGQQDQGNNDSMSAWYVVAAGGEQDIVISVTPHDPSNGAAVLERYTGAAIPTLCAVALGNTSPSISVPANSMVVAFTSSRGFSEIAPAAGWVDYYVAQTCGVEIFEKAVSVAADIAYTGGTADGTGITCITSAGNKPYAFAAISAVSGGAAAYDATILAESTLVNYWPLSHANDLKGTLNLIPTMVATLAPSITGDTDISTEFSNGGYYGASSAITQNPGDSFSYEFFVCLTGLPTALAGLITPADTAGLAVEVDSTGALHILFGYVIDQPTPIILIVGQSYLVLVTYDGSTANVYINGSTTSAYSFASSLAARGADGVLHIGYRTTIAAVRARMSKVAYYSGVLPAARGAAHYAAR